jgi:hypothetical protein
MTRNLDLDEPHDMNQMIAKILKSVNMPKRTARSEEKSDTMRQKLIQTKTTDAEFSKLRWS